MAESKITVDTDKTGRITDGDNNTMERGIETETIESEEMLGKSMQRQMTLPMEFREPNSEADCPGAITTSTTNETQVSGTAMRTIFKTKRFYESEDSNLSNTFSRTIRSLAATPTDELEISNIIGISDLGVLSTSTTSTETLKSLAIVDNDNLSNHEHSSDSQTENIDLYEEPNLQSLIDIVAEESVSLPYITEADILPLDSVATTDSITPHERGELVRTPSIVLECYNDDLIKTDEYELERAHHHYSPPISKQIPRRPLERFTFFDKTIEEEDVYDDKPSLDNPANANLYNKGTNTEVPFNCKNIPPIKEAAQVKLKEGSSEDSPPTSPEPLHALEVFEYAETVPVNIFETAHASTDLDGEENYRAVHKSGSFTAIVGECELNVHECQSTSIQQQRSEITKKIMSRRVTSSTSSTSSVVARSSVSTPSSAGGVFSPSVPSSPIDVGVNTDLVLPTTAQDTTAAPSKFEKKKKSSTDVPAEKKRKSKKTKKLECEKENISVKQIYLMAQPPVNWRPREHQNRTVTISRDVSVKHLCRSFGDLTVIDENRLHLDLNLKRAKSVGDVRRSDRIQTGVSVKLLRDSYCSLIALGSASSIDNSPHSSKKSSFSKFDALQKKNILRVRSSDAGKAQEKFNDTNVEPEKNCRACGKIVYKMEEIKAEKNIWHRNCFRCKECSKQLNVDTYQSHESLLYCKPHFKLLLAPKAVEDNEPVKPRKPEMIIRENQPVELPPDVVRASDKPDLGLEELQQLNVKSRFQVFENYQENTDLKTAAALDRSPSGVKRSASILSKLAKFKAKGMNTGVSDDALNDVPYEESSSEDDDEDIPDGEDVDLIRAKRAQRERPMSFGNMNDIKTKFEKGHILTKEERREECKQEIQNIRSRLFMGKQARIKEMYQQAVAESEQGITSAGKKPEIEIGDMAKTIKERFEKGEVFNREGEETDSTNHKVQDEEMAVFEQGIGKRSRSIFMELDASASKSPQTMSPMPPTPRTPDAKKQCQPFTNENVVKYDEKPDDIKIETSEISSKFKFFETYNPNDKKHHKEFRITPPREGVVKMPSPERDVYVDPTIVRADEKIDDPAVAEQTHTTTKMLSVFRQMEQKKFQNQNEAGPKPLKRFTPPPDENRRVYTNDSEEELSGSEDEEGDEEEEEEMGEEEESEAENRPTRYDDEFLKQAQSAARAKQLRAKFEKWEANEIRRELSNGTVNIYDQVENADDGQTETAKSLRAKFESMKESPNQTTRPRVQVNRFV